tara:strand:+ start:166 stop:450 length:285 start_codon:yes stop_codon:yes gene_type:complete
MILFHILSAGMDPFFAFGHSEFGLNIKNRVDSLLTTTRFVSPLWFLWQTLPPFSFSPSIPFPNYGIKSGFLLKFTLYRESIPEYRFKSPFPLQN